MRALRWVAAVALAGALARLALVVAGQLAWPFDLDLETPVLCAVRVMRSGLNPYGPEAYSGGPFALVPYPPLYLWLVAWLPSPAGQPFLAGRLVSLVAMLAAGALLFRADGRFTQRPLAALAAAWFFLLWPPVCHAAYLRMDSLALALSVGALVLVAAGGTARVLAAALLCALAVSAKQSYVAASAAGLLFLWSTDRRRALLFGGVLALLLGGGAAAATLGWGAGFWFNLLSPTRLPSSWSGLAQAWASVLRQPAYAGLLVLAGAVALVALRQTRLSGWRRSPWPAYALCSCAVLTRSALTTGANELYYMEFALALLLWLTFSLGRAGRPDGVRAGRAGGAGRTGAGAALALAAVLAGHELLGTWTRVPGLPLPEGPVAEHARTYYAGARARLAKLGLPAPSVLNLGSPRHASGIADDVRLNYPWLYDRMWQAGLLSPRPLVEALARRDFDLVVIATEVQLPPFGAADEPRTAVLAAVLEHYRPLGQDLIFRYYGRGP